MKRKLLILSVLAICVAMLAGGTLAFFTSEDKAHNVITTGGVEITLQEWADEAKTTPFKDLTGVMPNTTVTKIAEIRNTGASDAWVRVKVEKNIRLQGDGTPDTGLVELKLNTVDWTEKDGYYYYNKILKPGDPVPDALALSAPELFLAERFGLGSFVIGLVYIYFIVYFGFTVSFLHCCTFAVLFNKRSYTLTGVDTMIQITNVFYHKAAKLTSNI